MTLEEINRDEWADKPYLIELRGGYYDGDRCHLRDLPYRWKVIEPAPPISFTAIETVPDTPVAGIPIATYQMTDHVTDDGARIYEYYGHE